MFASCASNTVYLCNITDCPCSYDNLAGVLTAKFFVILVRDVNVITWEI